MFVLAHLSDPHLGPIPRPRLSELAGKRALGYLNWRAGRRALHRAEVLDELIADLKAASPDHIAVTGDLINIALAAEFAPARAWLERVGKPDQVTLVPGNHDAYVGATADYAHRIWRDYMRGDDPTPGQDPFPFVRRRGPVALIGLSSAVPQAPFMATGRLGAAQLARFDTVLRELREKRLFRVVLIHHPPVSGQWHKRLIDAEGFRAVMARHGAELVLHGHDHLHSLVWLDGPGHKIPAIGVPSASARDAQHVPAAYNLYRIDGAPGAWRCEVVSRGFRGVQGSIGEISRGQLMEGKMQALPK
ncbi:MAG: metallophosphoesterase family protein [Xanthobacteraceae bacterium]